MNTAKPQPKTCQDRKHHLTAADLFKLGKWIMTAKPGDVFICPCCNLPHTTITKTR